MTPTPDETKDALIRLAQLPDQADAEALARFVLPSMQSGPRIAHLANLRSLLCRRNEARALSCWSGWSRDARDAELAALAAEIVTAVECAVETDRQHSRTVDVPYYSFPVRVSDGG